MAFVEMKCGQCGEPFCLLDSTIQALRRSSQIFYCPWGHQRHFPQGDSETDKLRRERDRLKQENARIEDERRMWAATANAQLEQRRAAERRVSAAMGQITKMKKRAAAGVCPCCNRQFTDLQRHMATKHAGFLAEEVLPEGASVQ